MAWLPMAATAITAIGGIKSILSKNDGPAPPSVTAPTVMPTPDDEAIQAEKRKKLSALSQRRGRQSTILSDNTQSTDLLGG